MKTDDIKWLPTFVAILMIAGGFTLMDLPGVEIMQDLTIGYLMASLTSVVISKVDRRLYDSVMSSWLSRTIMVIAFTVWVYCTDHSIPTSLRSVAGWLLG